jgi:hypothetical protein
MNSIFLYDWNNVTNFTYHISYFFPLKFNKWSDAHWRE